MTIRNRHTDDSGPLDFGIGPYDVTEDDEVPFKPTRHELFQIARYWAECDIESQWFLFFYQYYSSREYQVQIFAHDRLARIADVLGQEVVDRAIHEVLDEFSSKNPDFKTFRSGTEEEQRALRKKIDEKLGIIDEELGIDGSGPALR